MAKRKSNKDKLIRQILPCECCGERDGELNSRFLFNSPISTQDCGDWVCCQCEQEAENCHNKIEHPPYG